MTIAARINVVFVCAALLLCFILTGFTAYREYHIALDRAVDAALARVASRPDLQFELYRRDAAALSQILDDLVDVPTVAAVLARDGLGEVLAQREAGNIGPSFSTLRGDLSVADTGLTAFTAEMAPSGTGLWAAWRESELPIYLTVPVLTSVNPVQRGLKAYDFFVAPANPDAKASRRVIGYIQVDISRAQLLQRVGPVASGVFYWSLALVVLCGVLVMLATRRITTDLSRLARLAEEVASGQVEKPLEIEASGEIRNIANVLNSVIGGFTSHKREIDVGHRLLSMKVDERTTQLSRRDEELNKAAEEINATKSQLQQLAYYDSLTALPNRRLFSEQLDLLLGLSQRNGHTLALLFLNVDNFKRINDSLGYAGGDLVLVEVAKRLSHSVRESDRVAHNVDATQKIDVSRLGGDEFTVVLNQLDRVDSAGVIAQRLLEALLEPIVIEGQEIVVACSIGIAVAPQDGSDVESLLKAAGVAMHHAKASSRDKFLFYSEHMDTAGVGRLQLESDLRKAVERSELVLHYQPQVNIFTGAVTGAEALLRWQHPEHGEIPPFQFVPIAEEIGVIDQLGDWVLGETCRQIKEFDALGLTLPKVVINISAFQFNPGFVDRVREVLQQFDLPAARLELGLTEGLLADQDRTTGQCLQDLDELGLCLSVDDFGTGYSPLGYLASCPLDELKLDRSFVLDCDKNDNSARLVIAIVAMARSLGLNIVAEGVETEEQARFLIDHGAQVVQGYLFSRPVPAAELRSMLAPWHFVEQLQAIQG